MCGLGRRLAVAPIAACGRPAERMKMEQHLAEDTELLRTRDIRISAVRLSESRGLTHDVNIIAWNCVAVILPMDTFRPHCPSHPA